MSFLFVACTVLTITVLGLIAYGALHEFATSPTNRLADGIALFALAWAITKLVDDLL